MSNTDTTGKTDFAHPLPGVARTPLRIAMSIWMFKPGTGGLQSHAEHLARHLIARGHQVTVITRFYTFLPEGMGFLHDRETCLIGEVDNVPVKAFSYPKVFRPLHFLIAKLKDRPGFRTLAKVIYRFQARWGNEDLFSGYDILHHVGQATAFVGFAAADGAEKNKIPFVIQPTCHPHQIGDGPLDLTLYREANRAMVHTEYEKKYLRPFLGEMDIDVVGNGIEDRTDGNGDRFRKQHGIHGPLILYIGRRDPDKGYPLVIEAFQKVRDRNGDATLVCMGPPGSTPKSEIPGSIHFEYADEQTKHDALAAATCLCVPSEGESFGLVYMEAGRYGKPVIARRLPVMEELLQNGKAGMLIGTLNADGNSNTVSSSEVAEAIITLIDSPEIQSELGEACRKASKSFVWEKVVSRFEDSYYQALESFHSAS